MNPVAVLLVAGLLALAAVFLVFVRVRQFGRIRSVVKELEKSDQYFSTQVSRIEKLIGRLEAAASEAKEAHRPNVDRFKELSPVQEWLKERGEQVMLRVMKQRGWAFVRPGRAHPDENPSRAYERREKAWGTDYDSGEMEEDMISAGG